jgi:hypothetical protein
MRQTISGLIAAIAVVAAGTVPASACGLFESACGHAYIEAPVYSGCNTGCGGGWAGYEHMPDPELQYHSYVAPVHQYYFADQGPTYTGPGEFAPYPTYQEAAVSGWGAYQHHPYYYGYDGGRYADATSHYYDGAPNQGPGIYGYHHRWHAHPGYHGWAHPGMHYGYHHGYSMSPHGYYGEHHSMRYGYHAGMPHHYGYGYGGHMMHRHY